MKIGMAVGLTIGIVGTAMVLNNEDKLIKMYKKSKKALMKKMDNMSFM